MIDALLLAGGGTAAAANKAFLDVAGRPLVWYVARALAEAPSVGRIVAVGPAEDLRRACGPILAAVVPETGSSVVENLLAALAALPPAPRVLAAAADIPLLSAAVVEEFLSACAKEEADFYYPIVPQTVVQDRYPGARKTFVRVLEGSFTGGSMFVFNPSVVPRVRELLDKMVRARKKPWIMAGIVGWSTVMKLASGRLAISEVEARLGEITGLVLRAVVLRRPELALDVDLEHPENLELIRRALQDSPER
ncbi:MAG: nucleotidyltransferase family protein [Armatimonadota bacterium]|nr:nucleotidyltransferase family protein [Armatimonadota bacterium]MDR7464603.1 nucleotidyltransferase family protein [Armatimonadota bacterium]MDR7469012.1 nucleotidyltransferase family protein [Armatimonadota bacterium]MDR7538053.1 nucleotidyltransferase family protein [Armatimonadota bacterium]